MPKSLFGGINLPKSRGRDPPAAQAATAKVPPLGATTAQTLSSTFGGRAEGRRDTSRAIDADVPATRGQVPSPCEQTATNQAPQEPVYKRLGGNLSIGTGLKTTPKPEVGKRSSHEDEAGFDEIQRLRKENEMLRLKLRLAQHDGSEMEHRTATRFIHSIAAICAACPRQPEHAMQIGSVALQSLRDAGYDGLMSQADRLRADMEDWDNQTFYDFFQAADRSAFSLHAIAQNTLSRQDQTARTEVKQQQRDLEISSSTFVQKRKLDSPESSEERKRPKQASPSVRSASGQGEERSSAGVSTKAEQQSLIETQDPDAESAPGTGENRAIQLASQEIRLMHERYMQAQEAVKQWELYLAQDITATERPVAEIMLKRAEDWATTALKVESVLATTYGKLKNGTLKDETIASNNPAWMASKGETSVLSPPVDLYFNPSEAREAGAFGESHGASSPMPQADKQVIPVDVEVASPLPFFSSSPISIPEGLNQLLPKIPPSLLPHRLLAFDFYATWASTNSRSGSAGSTKNSLQAALQQIASSPNARKFTEEQLGAGFLLKSNLGGKKKTEVAPEFATAVVFMHGMEGAFADEHSALSLLSKLFLEKSNPKFTRMQDSA